MDLALNILQWLIYHKTQPNQTKSTLYGEKIFFYCMAGFTAYQSLLGYFMLKSNFYSKTLLHFQVTYNDHL